MRDIESRRHRSTKKWATLGALACMLTACSRAGGAAPGIETAVTTQSTITPAPASPEVFVSASPSMDPGEFWAQVGGRGENIESFDSLGSLIRDADLVAVGVVTEFREGRRIAFPETGETIYMAEVLVRVSDTLRGSPISPSDSPGTVVVETSMGFFPDPSRLAELEASTPIGSRVVVFLVNKSADAVLHGFSPDAPYAGETYYLLRNGVQSAIRDDAGAAGIGPGAEDWPWLAKFKGQTFDRVVRDIQAAASTAP